MSKLLMLSLYYSYDKVRSTAVIFEPASTDLVVATVTYLGAQQQPILTFDFIYARKEIFYAKLQMFTKCILEKIFSYINSLYFTFNELKMPSERKDRIVSQKFSRVSHIFKSDTLTWSLT